MLGLQAHATTPHSILLQGSGYVPMHEPVSLYETGRRKLLLSVRLARNLDLQSLGLSSIYEALITRILAP